MMLRRLRLAALLLLLFVMTFAAPASVEAQARGSRTSKASKGARSVAKSNRAKGAHKRPSKSKPTTSLFGAKGSKANRNQGKWKSRRTLTAKDTGLKDHAARHSDASPKEYLQLGQKNVSHGRMLKGGGKHGKARYHIRKLRSGDFSMTITNTRGQILSIDTWKSPGTPLTRAAIERGLAASGVTPPKGFWKRL